MKIAVDARELAGKPTGVGRYLAELLACWSRDGAAAGHEILLLTPGLLRLPPGLIGSGGARVDSHVIPGNLPGGTRGSLGQLLWEQRPLPAAAAKLGADVLFCPGYSGPVVSRVPVVVAIHDVSYWAHPEWFNVREGLRRRLTTWASAYRARLVLTLTAFSRDEIIRWLDVDADRVRAIAPGAGGFFDPATLRDSLPALRINLLGEPEATPSTARNLRGEPQAMPGSTHSLGEPKATPGTARNLRGEPQAMPSPAHSLSEPKATPGTARNLRGEPQAMPGPTYSLREPQVTPSTARNLRGEPQAMPSPAHSLGEPKATPGTARNLRGEPQAMPSPAHSLGEPQAMPGSTHSLREPQTMPSPAHSLGEPQATPSARQAGAAPPHISFPPSPPEVPGGEGAGGSGGMARIVLTVGSIFNRRHVDHLIAAFARIAPRVPDARLVIVGENRTHPHQDLERLIRDLRMTDRVELRSYVSDDELLALYGQARAFAFLSTYEGFGLTPVEAIISGVPVVVYDSEVARETLPGLARFVPAGDLDALAAQLHAMLTAEPDPEQQAALAGAARARYPWARTAAITLAALEEAARR